MTPTFAAIADSLVDDFDLVEILELVTETCINGLGASAAGLMLANAAGGLQVMTSSSEAIRLLELQEIAAQEGPCPECFAQGQPVLNQRLVDAVERWPGFAPSALAAGYGCVEALPMRTRGSTIGALNLFHRSETGASPEALIAAQALADVATIAIRQHRVATDARSLTGDLREALDSRVVIEQAKGVLIGRSAVDVDTAFEAMRSYARRRRLKLRAVAEGVLAGTIDPLDG
ncbi:MAG TPA: GAF and ANTAR domain-containing protein [Acidimicrobiales bacterium]|nr:GAF and ANTAR domain-containing protein [Acidimicrobiales bacterium]